MSQSTEWRVAPGVDLPEYALAELQRVLIKNSEWDYVSGGHGRDYVDFDELFSTTVADTSAYSLLLDQTARLIEKLRDDQGYGTLAFVEGPRGPVGALSARIALSRATGMPTVIVRPYKRLLSQAIKPFQVPSKGPILIVTDVATTGTTISEATRLLWRIGARQCGALAFFDREEGAREFLDTLGVPLYYVTRPPSLAAT